MPTTKTRETDSSSKSRRVRKVGPHLAAIDALSRIVVEASIGLSETEDVNARRHLSRILALTASSDAGVSVSSAADTLGVSKPTVRAWLTRGVLTSVPEVTPKQVTVTSLGEVLAAVEELRAAQARRRVGPSVLELVQDRRDRRELEDRLAELHEGAFVVVDDLDALFADGR